MPEIEKKKKTIQNEFKVRIDIKDYADMFHPEQKALWLHLWPNTILT